MGAGRRYGRRAVADQDEVDVPEMRRRLDAERAELAALSASGAEARRVVELDQQSMGRLSRMDALQGQAMAQASERRRQLRLQQIEAALRRVDRDEFGWCLRCGETIAPARLKLDPATPTCRDCAA
jgi:DnaK suppressor protein